MKEIVFAGFGGQGVLTSGLIVSEIAVNKGMNATWIPSYGSAMRGGTANCTVKFGDGRIFNPSQEKPNILLAMNTPSFNKFIDIVAPNGTVIVNSDMVNYDPKVREDLTFVEIGTVIAYIISILSVILKGGIRMYGYNGKYLRINLKTREVKVEKLDIDIAKKYWTL